MKLQTMIIVCCALAGSSTVPMEKNDYSISIPPLPREIETQEIVNRIISTATSAKEALQSLDNYRLVNKAIAKYIDTHKQTIKKAIQERFLLETLASGAYSNSDIKKESLKILEQGESYKVMHHNPARDLITFIGTDDKLTAQNINAIMSLLKRSITEKNFLLGAAIVGALRYFISNKRLVLEPYLKNQFIQILESLADMGMQAQNDTAQIRELYDVINAFATKEFGKL